MNPSSNVILASLITNVFDVNRQETLMNDDYSLVNDWANSIVNLKLKGVIFHNNFSEKTCLQYQNEYIEFRKVHIDPNFNPNVYRYLLYDDLDHHNQEIENVFLTDISDVVLIQNPFIQSLYRDNPNSIFCGDERKTLNNEWMKAHSLHLRNMIHDYTRYEELFGEAKLLNCGVVGGNIKLMKHFVSNLANLHCEFNNNNKTAYTGDMGAFNYLIRTQYNNCILHGSPINTVFKGYEAHRTDCWFRHK